MLDWLLIARNLPWIVGLAAVLASLSAARWCATHRGLSVFKILAQAGNQAGVCAGLALICLGLALNTASWAGRVLWLALVAWLAGQAFSAWRARRPAWQTAPGASLAARPLPQRASGRMGQAARWLADMELWWLLALTPGLLFPGRLAPWLASLLLVPWLGRKLAYGRWTAPTVMDGPILVILLMLPVSLGVSLDMQRSLPKLYGILLGVAAFYAVVNWASTAQRAYRAAMAISLGGFTVACVSFVGTRWPGGPDLLPPTWRQLPELLTALGGSRSAGFNPNEVAGALCLFVPLLVSLLLDSFSARGTCDLSMPHQATHWLWPLVWALGLALMVHMLILSQSRSALLGIWAAIALLGVFQPRWRWSALGAGLVIAVLAWRSGSLEDILRSVLAFSPDRNLRLRFEMWQSALAMIRDYPFTGVGLNTFSLVANRLYPVLSVSPQRVLQWTHAHNMFLQVAVDLGIPGLVAYLALLLGSVWAFWSVYRSSVLSGLRPISVGLICCLFAYHLYGLADCFTLGAKPSLAMWAILGLLAALASLQTGQCLSEKTPVPAE